MDIQASELAALKGAIATLPSVPALHLETWIIQAYGGKILCFSPDGSWRPLRLFSNRSHRRSVWSLASSHAHLFRWVHVDGDHKGENVWSDLELGNRLLAVEGILCVDDFLNPRYRN